MLKKPKPSRFVRDTQPNPYDGADLLIRTAAGRPDLAVDYDEAREIFRPYGTDPDVAPLRAYLSRYGIFARRPDGRTAFYLSDEGLLYSRLGGYRGRIHQAMANRFLSWVGAISGTLAAAVAAYGVSLWAFAAILFVVVLVFAVMLRWLYRPGVEIPARPAEKPAEQDHQSHDQ